MEETQVDRIPSFVFLSMIKILQNGKTGSSGDKEVTIGETDAENEEETMEEKQVD